MFIKQRIHFCEPEDLRVRNVFQPGFVQVLMFPGLPQYEKIPMNMFQEGLDLEKYSDTKSWLCPVIPSNQNTNPESPDT